MKQKKISVNIGIGTTSLLAIFVILCLVAFAVLTFSTAQNDEVLAEKTAKSTTEYYQAQSRAEESLATALTYIADGNETAVKDLDITVTRVEAGTILNWETPVNNDKILIYEVLLSDSGKIMRNTHTVMGL